MPASLDRARVRHHLESLDLRALFIDELGWDHGGTDIEVEVAERTFALEAVAQKRSFVVYRYAADSDDAFPDQPTRQKIERVVARSVREHLIVYVTGDRDTQCWQWVKREPGRPDLRDPLILSRESIRRNRSVEQTSPTGWTLHNVARLG